MREYLKFYIDGQWVDPVDAEDARRRQPGDRRGRPARSPLGSAADVDKAVEAARKAFETYSQTSREERIDAAAAHPGRIPEALRRHRRRDHRGNGRAASLAAGAQAPIGIGHLSTAIEVLKNFKFEEERGTTRIVKEPIGVCGLITPWNWPINQIACKVVPALATGCTMVLKPSRGGAVLRRRSSPRSCDAAGVPAGVFNLVNGDGPGVGAAISSHPGIDMVSFTGSTRAGIEVASNAAADGQARGPGAGRQEPEHHPRRRRHRQERRRRRRRR